MKANIISFRYTNSKDNLKSNKSKGQVISGSMKRLSNFQDKAFSNANSKPCIADENNLNKLNFQTLSYDYRSFLQNNAEVINQNQSFCLIGKASQQFYKSSSRQEGDWRKSRVKSQHLKARNKAFFDSKIKNLNCKNKQSEILGKIVLKLPDTATIEPKVRQEFNVSISDENSYDSNKNSPCDHKLKKKLKYSIQAKNKQTLDRINKIKLRLQNSSRNISRLSEKRK